MKNSDLYQTGPAEGAKAPILITHFDGALDAGSAGSLAVVQLLRSLPSQRVATFNTDMLLDYRSHRPVMEVENWVTTAVSQPEIALDLVHDDAGVPILILHGPEPDSRWKAFNAAVRDLAAAAGVEVVFSFHGLPAAVPHSRPTTVHLQSTDADLVPDQPMMGGKARFPAPLSSYIQYQLHADGLVGVTLLAAVPYYMSDSNFPRASSALLRKLSDMADLSLPIGDLERGADEDATQVQKIVEVNPELQRTVQALEQHYDSISQAAAEGAELGLAHGSEDGAPARTGPVPMVDLPSWDSLSETSKEEGTFPEAERLGEEGSESIADVIGEAIEGYLKARAKPKGTPDVRLSANQTEASGAAPSTGSPGDRRHRARHRAPKPWEIKPPAQDEDGEEPDANDTGSEGS